MQNLLISALFSVVSTGLFSMAAGFSEGIGLDSIARVCLLAFGFLELVVVLTVTAIEIPIAITIIMNGIGLSEIRLSDIG
jgi:hypothetical protein